MIKYILASILTLVLSSCTTQYLITEVDKDTNTRKLVLIKTDNHTYYLRALPTSEADLVNKHLPANVRKEGKDYD